MPHLIVALVDDHDFGWRLEKIDRPQQRENLEAGHARRPASLARIERHFAGERARIRLLQPLNHPRLQHRIAHIGDAEGRLTTAGVAPIRVRRIGDDRARTR